MMKKEMLQDSVLLKNERLVKYKLFSAIFTYPDDNFFELFPELVPQKKEIISEYDRLFHRGKVLLYTTEYLSENIFERVDLLSDIMGFYKAFGVEPKNDRADHISAELEFMYLLILKAEKADTKEKCEICIDAQRKFFSECLYLPAKKIAEKIISESNNGFYAEVAKEFLEFLESEKNVIGGEKLWQQ
jgi:TorA maturation chaperone TorD